MLLRLKFKQNCFFQRKACFDLYDTPVSFNLIFILNLHCFKGIKRGQIDTNLGSFGVNRVNDQYSGRVGSTDSCHPYNPSRRSRMITFGDFCFMTSRKSRTASCESFPRRHRNVTLLDSSFIRSNNGLEFLFNFFNGMLWSVSLNSHCKFTISNSHSGLTSIIMLPSDVLPSNCNSFG